MKQQLNGAAHAALASSDSRSVGDVPWTHRRAGCSQRSPRPARRNRPPSTRSCRRPGHAWQPAWGFSHRFHRFRPLRRRRSERLFRRQQRPPGASAARSARDAEGCAICSCRHRWPGNGNRWAHLVTARLPATSARTPHPRPSTPFAGTYTASRSVPFSRGEDVMESLTVVYSCYRFVASCHVSVAGQHLSETDQEPMVARTAGGSQLVT